MVIHPNAPSRTRDHLADPTLLPPRILLAEDDFEMRALLSTDLRSAGYSVVECSDGSSLLGRLAASSPIWEVGVDLVVSDVVLPTLTGLEVLERFRSWDPFTPFIILTAFGSAAIRRAATRLGAVAVLDKPFEAKELLQLVRDSVGPASRTLS